VTSRRQLSKAGEALGITIQPSVGGRRNLHSGGYSVGG
jgi:hypothetical protein